MNLGVDPRPPTRCTASSPASSTGKHVRVAVFAHGRRRRPRPCRHRRGRRPMETIRWQDRIDRCIATPDMMPLVGRLGKIRPAQPGMPNPKVSTVTMDVATAVRRTPRAARSSSRPRRPASFTPVLARPCVRRRQWQAGREHPRLRARGEPCEAVGRQGAPMEEGLAVQAGRWVRACRWTWPTVVGE